MFFLDNLLMQNFTPLLQSVSTVANPANTTFAFTTSTASTTAVSGLYELLFSYH